MEASRFTDFRMVNDLIIRKVGQARALLAQCRDAKSAKKVADMAHAAAVYAKRQKLSQESVEYAQAVKVDAMTLLGDFLRKQKKRTGGDAQRTRFRKGSESPKALSEHGISFKESAISQRLSKLAEADPEKHEAIRSSRVAMAGVVSSAHVSANDGENEWYTPEPFAIAAHRVMGKIDLDPASTAEANDVIGAEDFFTKEQDGLKKEWRGCIWLNPPYAQPLIGQFVDCLVDHWNTGTVLQAIVLVNNATETSWFGKLVSVASVVCFPQGRIKFWSPRGPAAAPLQGQAILYLGRKMDAFTEAFKQFGWVARVIH